MPWSSLISVGGSLLGGLLGEDSSSQAADAGVASTREAIAEQRRQYDQNRADQAQYMRTGNAANRRLALLMGLGDAASGTGAPSETADQIRQRLINQYTTTTPGGRQLIKVIPGASDNGNEEIWGDAAPSSTVNEAGLNAAIQAEMARQAEATRQSQASVESDPNFGALTRRFSLADLEADPVYKTGLKFGLDQGTDAINARAIAGGGYDSGATLKALTRFANDYGTTKAEGAYNRYNNDNTNLYNRYAGLSGSGQTATNQVATAGANAANQISGLTTDAGTARAAGIVGGANAWGDALGTAANTASNYFKRLNGFGGSGTGNGNGGYEYGGISYNNPSAYVAGG